MHLLINLLLLLLLLLILMYIIGDEEFNEKLALSMLVHLLGKKSLSNIYCEYEVP